MMAEKTATNKMARSGYANASPEMKAKAKELEGGFFYCGRGMQKKCIHPSKAFLEYAGREWGESAVQSILQGKIATAGLAPPKKCHAGAECRSAGAF